MPSKLRFVVALLVAVVALVVFMCGTLAADETAAASAADAKTAAVEAEHTETGEAASHSGHADAGGEEPNPLAIDPDLAIWTGIIFLLLFLILRKFAWPQIAAALDAREKNISDNIASAAALHEEAKRRLAEHEAKLASTAGEVRALLEEARRDAEATKSRIAAEARKAADEERQRAVREIEQAKDGAIQELAVASANVAVDLARKVVREKLTSEEQSSLVRNALDSLAAAAPSKN